MILGTRGSALALAQTQMVLAALRSAHPGHHFSHEVIHTTGDLRQDLRLGRPDSGADKGVWTKELEAALATARREGRKEMAEDVAGWHEARAKEHDAMERKFQTIGQHLAPDTMQSAMRCAEAAIQHRQRAAAIRAAAGEGK